MQYDYRNAMKKDIADYIKENGIDLNQYDDRGKAYEALYDLLWTEDSVTGNGSCVYYIYTADAEAALSGNRDLLVEALEEFGNETESYKTAILNPSYADVVIRCYLLSSVLDEVLRAEWEKRGKK